MQPERFLRGPARRSDVVQHCLQQVSEHRLLCMPLCRSGVANLLQVPVLPCFRNDVFGARDAGCFAWLYGLDVLSMHEMADRILWGSEDDDRLRAIARW